MPRALAAALIAGALAWSAAVIAAPYLLVSGIPLPQALAGLFYSAAGLVCHQRPERSFHAAGVALPVCARCAGLYWSAAIGGVAGWLVRPRTMSGRVLRIVLGVAALPTAATVVSEFAGLAYPSNTVRAISALPLGLAGAWIFVTSLRAESPRDRSRAANGL